MANPQNSFVQKLNNKADEKGTNRMIKLIKKGQNVEHLHRNEKIKQCLINVGKFEHMSRNQIIKQCFKKFALRCEKS